MTDSAEMIQKSSMKLADMEKLSPEWCRKSVFLGFLCKKHNSPMYCVFNLCYVYTTQPCRLYISAVSFI